MARARKKPSGCDWSRRAEYATLGPGAPVACDARATMVGRTVRLGGRTMEVVGCATPVKRHDKPGRARSTRGTCEGAYLVHRPGELRGVNEAVPRSRVREAARVERNEPCDQQVSTVETDPRYIEREAMKLGVHPWELVRDLEFRHRRGSSVCCQYHRASAESLVELLDNPLIDSDEERVELARALGLKVSSVAGIVSVLRARRVECWDQHKDRATKRAGKGGRDSTARVAARRRRDAIVRGEDVSDPSSEYREGLASGGRKRAPVKRFRPG